MRDWSVSTFLLGDTKQLDLVLTAWVVALWTSHQQKNSISSPSWIIIWFYICSRSFHDFSDRLHFSTVTAWEVLKFMRFKKVRKSAASTFWAKLWWAQEADPRKRNYCIKKELFQRSLKFLVVILILVVALSCPVSSHICYASTAFIFLDDLDPEDSSTICANIVEVFDRFVADNIQTFDASYKKLPFRTRSSLSRKTRMPVWWMDSSST